MHSTCRSATVPGVALHGSRPSQCASALPDRHPCRAIFQCQRPHAAGIARYIIQRGARKRRTQSLLRKYRKALVIGVEQPVKFCVEGAIAGRKFAQNKRLEKPCGVRQVPFRWRGFGDRLNHHVFGRQPAAQGKCLFAYSAKSCGHLNLQIHCRAVHSNRLHSKKIRRRPSISRKRLLRPCKNQFAGPMLATVAFSDLKYCCLKSLDGTACRSPQEHIRGEDLCPSSMLVSGRWVFSFSWPYWPCRLSTARRSKCPAPAPVPESTNKADAATSATPQATPALVDRSAGNSFAVRRIHLSGRCSTALRSRSSAHPRAGWRFHVRSATLSGGHCCLCQGISNDCGGLEQDGHCVPDDVRR